MNNTRDASPSTRDMTFRFDDPFDVAVMNIIDTQRAKKADYSPGATRWANFEATAAHFSVPKYRSADFLELLKLSRLEQLHKNGHDPVNEAMADTYLDKAVYAALAYAMYLDEMGEPRPRPIPPTARPIKDAPQA